eukprot:COSAG02_NODE_1363_length_13047_cov_5.747374_3_plen_336_part_00
MQDLLETTGNLATFRGSPNSAADCLLTWLDQLPAAVIPATLHDDALDAVQAGGLAGALSIVKQLTSEQKAAVYQVQSTTLFDAPATKSLTLAALCVCAKMLRLCNSIASPGIDPVRQWLQEHQRPLVAAATVRRGASGFGIVMNDAAIVCGGDGHTCDVIPLGATVVKVGTVSVRDKADVIACIRSVPADAEVQFTYRYSASASAQEEQLHGVVQALRAAEMPPQTWVTELAGASLSLRPDVFFSRSIDRVDAKAHSIGFERRYGSGWFPERVFGRSGLSSQIEWECCSWECKVSQPSTAGRGHCTCVVPTISAGALLHLLTTTFAFMVLAMHVQ